jgi:hypothetical protein
LKPIQSGPAQRKRDAANSSLPKLQRIRRTIDALDGPLAAARIHQRIGLGRSDVQETEQEFRMEHAPKFSETELRKAVSGALEQMAIDDHQLIFMELGERAVERRVMSNQSA